jgi:hypothetical protein
MRKHFRIQGQFQEGDAPLFWSNDDGWVSFNGATTFSRGEIRLPMETTGIVWLNASGYIETFEAKKFTGQWENIR